MSLEEVEKPWKIAAPLITILNCSRSQYLPSTTSTGTFRNLENALPCFVPKTTGYTLSCLSSLEQFELFSFRCIRNRVCPRRRFRNRKRFRLRTALLERRTWTPSSLRWIRWRRSSTRSRRCLKTFPRNCRGNCYVFPRTGGSGLRYFISVWMS